MENQMNIQSSEIENIVSQFKSASTSVSSNVTEKLKSGFKGLTDCDLFVEGIEILVSNAEQVSSVLDLIAQSISSHLANMQELEMGNQKQFNDWGSGNGSGVNPPIDTTNPAQIVEGIVASLQNTDKNALSNLIHNINVLKDKVNLDELLFDPKQSANLFKILKDQLKLEGEFSVEDIKLIKKTLINKLFSEKLDNIELEDTIYILREFLIDFAKENNITVGDLLVDSKYEGILKNLLIKIYEGGIHNSKVTEEEFDKIKAYIAKRLEIKQEGPSTTSEDVEMTSAFDHLIKKNNDKENKETVNMNESDNTEEKTDVNPDEFIPSEGFEEIEQTENNDKMEQSEDINQTEEIDEGTLLPEDYVIEEVPETTIPEVKEGGPNGSVLYG